MTCDLLNDAAEFIQGGRNPCDRAGLLIEWVKRACKEWPDRSDEIRTVAHAAMWQCGPCDFSEQIEQAIITREGQDEG